MVLLFRIFLWVNDLTIFLNEKKNIAQQIQAATQKAQETVPHNDVLQDYSPFSTLARDLDGRPPQGGQLLLRQNHEQMWARR